MAVACLLQNSDVQLKKHRAILVTQATTAVNIDRIHEDIIPHPHLRVDIVRSLSSLAKTQFVDSTTRQEAVVANEVRRRNGGTCMDQRFDTTVTQKIKEKRGWDSHLL
jgi:hypothetical protein